MHLGAGIAAHTHAIYIIYGLDVRWMKFLAMEFREDWLNSFGDVMFFVYPVMFTLFTVVY